ncbi:TspO/MBR family protein [Brugia pahangi]
MIRTLLMYRYDDSIHGIPTYGYGIKHTSMNSIWTSEDTKRAILFSLVPGALSLYANVSFRKEENLSGWSFAINKPNWAPENPAIYGFIDGVTIAPLGLASYMAYKYGGGLAHNDTKLALTLYGGSMICAFLTMPLVKKKSSHSLFRNTLIMHLTAAGAAIAFLKIDYKAGLLLVPYVLWTGFYTYLTYAMNKTNKSETKER